MSYKDILGGLALALVYWVLCTLVLAYQPAEDFTDTGVGCVEDCLEPMEGESQ